MRILEVAVAVAVLGVGVIFYNSARNEKYCEEIAAAPKTFTIKHKSIDQVFRDHNGYRFLYTDEKGIVHEEKFYEGAGAKPILPPESHLYPHSGNPFHYLSLNRSVVIIKDLPEDQKPYADILHYTMEGCRFKLAHAEVHLRKHQNLTAGSDSYIEAKIRKYEPMQEIR